jgi:hypothetical protein
MGRDALYPPPTFPGFKKKVIIAGTRTFGQKNWHRTLLREKMDFLTKNFFDVCVVTGAGKGADHWGEEWAHSKYYTVVRFHPDWDKHGKKAGPIRNREMAEYAEYCVCFWDGKSKGTKNMIELAREYGLKLRIVLY